jgi:hypothetical protein
MEESPYGTMRVKMRVSHGTDLSRFVTLCSVMCRREEVKHLSQDFLARNSQIRKDADVVVEWSFVERHYL